MQPRGKCHGKTAARAHVPPALPLAFSLAAAPMYVPHIEPADPLAVAMSSFRIASSLVVSRCNRLTSGQKNALDLDVRLHWLGTRGDGGSGERFAREAPRVEPVRLRGPCARIYKWLRPRQIFCCIATWIAGRHYLGMRVLRAEEPLMSTDPLSAPTGAGELDNATPQPANPLPDCPEASIGIAPDRQRRPDTSPEATDPAETLTVNREVPEPDSLGG